MERVRILTGCRASGRGYAAGQEVAVGVAISAEDAALLVRLGRAVPAPSLPRSSVGASQPRQPRTPSARARARDSAKAPGDA